MVFILDHKTYFLLFFICVSSIFFFLRWTLVLCFIHRYKYEWRIVKLCYFLKFVSFRFIHPESLRTFYYYSKYQVCRKNVCFYMKKECDITSHKKIWCNVTPSAITIYLMHFLRKWSLHKLVFWGNGLWYGEQYKKELNFQWGT